MDLVITGLAILLVFSNLFWALVTHRLVNKLMSRTFWEYQQAKQIPKEMELNAQKNFEQMKIPTTNENELDTLDELIKKVLPLG